MAQLLITLRVCALPGFGKFIRLKFRWKRQHLDIPELTCYREQQELTRKACRRTQEAGVPHRGGVQQLRISNAEDFKESF